MAILGLIDVFVARSPSVWTWLPARSKIGAFFALERQVIVPAPGPQVLIMGSSRIRDAVAPRVMEAALGLARGSVLNLGLTSGTTFDAQLLYRRNRRKLSGAKLLIVGVEDWYANGSLKPSATDRAFGSLGDRWSVFRGMPRLKLLIGWVWRTFNARDALRAMVERVAKGETRRRFPVVLNPDGRVRWRGGSQLTGPLTVKFDNNLAQNYLNFRPGAGRFQQLARLIAMARADGLSVWIVQVPLRDGYVARAKTDFAAPYRFYRRQVYGLAARFPGIRIRFYERASDLHIPPKYYYDYGHLTVLGCRQFTRLLASEIRKRDLFGTGPGRPSRPVRARRITEANPATASFPFRSGAGRGSFLRRHGGE